MENLSYLDFRVELLSLDAHTKISFDITANFCSFASYHYICTAVDALVILHLFSEGFSFTYQILSQ